jgi:hypothetical protein
LKVGVNPFFINSFNQDDFFCETMWAKPVVFFGRFFSMFSLAKYDKYFLDQRDPKYRKTVSNPQ